MSVKPDQIPASVKPMLIQYLQRYQEDPTSRVFAPLAEAYRKAGFPTEAEEIAREGLRHHPHFVGGRVALARALFDQGKHTEVIDELLQVVRDAPDNLIAQRLLAESYLVLGRSGDALDAYKMLLYYSPQDWETARLVQELESRAYEQEGQALLKEAHTEVPNEGYEVRPAGGAIDSSPEHRRLQWARKIERLQGLLARVDRYRQRVTASS